MTTRIRLTATEREVLRSTMKLPETASVQTIMREFARHYWDNHARNMLDGDPVDAVPLAVSETKLEQIIAHYEKEYRGIGDRRA